MDEMIRRHRDRLFFHLEGHVRMDRSSNPVLGRLESHLSYIKGWESGTVPFLLSDQGKQSGFILHDKSKFCDTLPGALVDQDGENVCILCCKEYYLDS